MKVKVLQWDSLDTGIINNFCIARVILIVHVIMILKHFHFYSHYDSAGFCDTYLPGKET